VEIICHNALAIDVIRVGAQLTDPSGHYQYEVAAACSGMRSLISIFLMSTVYAFLGFTSWWKRGALIGSALPFAVLGNSIRLLFIIVAADLGGQSWGNWVHDNTVLSLVPYLPAIIGLFGLGSWLEGKKKTKPSQKAAQVARLNAPSVEHIGSNLPKPEAQV
jgi:exosortase